MADPSPDLPILDEIAIETPCLVPWSEIQGTGQVHSCKVCRKNVVDLIELPTVVAAQVLAESETLPCVRICRAPDGRIVTADNPVGFGIRIWRGLRRRSTWAASLFALLFLPGCSLCNSFFQYGAPARQIKPLGPKKAVSDDSTWPKVESPQNTGLADSDPKSDPR